MVQQLEWGCFRGRTRWRQCLGRRRCRRSWPRSRSTKHVYFQDMTLLKKNASINSYYLSGTVCVCSWNVSGNLFLDPISGSELPLDLFLDLTYLCPVLTYSQNWPIVSWFYPISCSNLFPVSDLSLSLSVNFGDYTIQIKEVLKINDLFICLDFVNA